MVFAIAGKSVMQGPQICVDGKRRIECEHAASMVGCSSWSSRLFIWVLLHGLG
jgi:hypothetical protein